MKKILFATMAALMICSMFAGIKTGYSVNANGMAFNPIEKVVDPAMDGSDLTFLYEVVINTSYLISAWEAKLLWDPAVLRCLDIVWGPFMTDGGTIIGKEITNTSTFSSGGESVQFGQNFAVQHTVHGTGTLAWVNFTFVLPGVTQVWFLISRVWDDALNEYNLLPPTGTTVHGRVRSNRPHPSFTWKTDDGRNPCPKHYVADQGDSLIDYDVVHFNASASYDVGNVYWDGSAWARNMTAPAYPDIVEYMWKFADGFTSNDIRLDPTYPPYAYNSVVRLGDADVGAPLVKFKSFEMYNDTDGSKSYTIGDLICNDTNADGKFNLTKGDFVIYPPLAPPPAEGSTLKAFTQYEEHMENYAVDGYYQAGEYIYKDMQYKDTTWVDPGYGVVSCGSMTTDHVYSGYNKAGWIVELIVFDSEGEYWSTYWRFGGSYPTDKVPMYRDLAIVDIWPSLPPYQNYQLYDDDWWSYWFFDSTDFWIPYAWDAYYNYELTPSYCSDMEMPEGTTVKDGWLDYGSAGLWVLITGNNFGTVTEKVIVNLYAMCITSKITKPSGQPYTAVLDYSVEQIGTWTKTLAANTGTGWGCYTIWMPPKNGVYILFGTIEAANDASIADQDRSNNYFALPHTFTNLAIWNTTDYSLIKDMTVGKYLCDLNGDGSVGSADLSTLLAYFGAKPTGWPKVGTTPIVPK